MKLFAPSMISAACPDAPTREATFSMTNNYRHLFPVVLELP